MKKSVLFFIIIATALSLNAQEPFQFSTKLDSVIGSDNFGWTQWKKTFTYYVADAVIQEDTYNWENGEWKLSGEIDYQYDTVEFMQIQGWITLKNGESGLERVSWTDFEYDDLNRLTLIMNYLDADTAWIEDSKYEYHYNDEGLLDTCLYSTIRNGSWRETELRLYTSDDAQQCTSLRVQRKGGWGPNANQWRDSYRYDFEYENGKLARELYYLPVGWFGSEMAIDSKWEYEFDANGNLLRKTGSVYNEMDWIERDVFENSFDPNVDASTVLGLIPFWMSMGSSGMDYATGAKVPIKNQWLSCSIASSELDTQFQLYCSGFAAVEENTEAAFKAYFNGENLVVMSEEPIDITVFDMMGRQVASRVQTQHSEFNLTPGLYLVRNGAQVMKVVVR